jgi:hypothetical protein
MTGYNRSMRKLTATWIVSAALAGAASMTGWISDASCGAANANAKPESRECARSCLKGGADAVFVSDGDNKVYKITGKADPKQHLDYKVRITGEVKGDTISVQEIRKAE